MLPQTRAGSIAARHAIPHGRSQLASSFAETARGSRDAAIRNVAPARLADCFLGRLFRCHVLASDWA